ncbi:MAG: hypothetical protein AAFR30_16680, partial [Cyanobacteria bacterium J06628_4]
MGAALGQWRQRIREYKNDLVQTYFDYRIEAASQPYGVAFRGKPYRLPQDLSSAGGSAAKTQIAYDSAIA